MWIKILSFHLNITGIIIIDNWCHPRWRRSILGICRSKGLNYVFWLFNSFVFSKVFKIFFSSAIPSLNLVFLTEDCKLLNLFFSATLLSGLGIIFISLLLYYIIWNYYFSNSSLGLGEACSVAADCGDPQVLWILLWRCKIRLLMILNDTQALIFSMLRYHDYNCDNTNLSSSGVLLRAQTCSFCRILSLDRAL